MTVPIYGSYNARSYQPSQVAERFVYSPYIEQVSDNFNTLILGPRGSGKTTLLKMLTLPALAAWADCRKNDLSHKMDYISIYVPSDFTWNPAFRVNTPVDVGQDVTEFFMAEIFSAYVKLAVCDTLESIFSPEAELQTLPLQFPLPKNEQSISEFIAHMRAEWHVESRFNGIFGLKHGIERQISALQRKVSLASIQNRPIEWDALDLPFLGRNIFDELRLFSKIWKSTIGIENRWAICVDELEIAPKTIKKMVLGSMRSFDQDFRIKVSASPNDESLVGLATSTVPGGGQDYRPVRLYDQAPSQLNSFSRDVFSRICIDRYGRDISPEKILGPSIYNTSDGEADRIPRLARDGLYGRAISRLAQIDPSFALYLGHRKFDIGELNHGSESRKARIRKLITTVLWREKFLFSAEGFEGGTGARGRRRRTFRTVQDIYLGADHLFRICDGNPRALIGILDTVLSTHDDPSVPVPAKIQADAVRSAIVSQMLLLSTLGDDEISPDGITLVELIELLGEYFRSSLLGPEFTADPVLGFNLKGPISKRLRDLIGLAINQGAIVARPGKNEPPGSFQKSELRLSYLIGVQYDLPLVRGRAVSLSNILKKDRDQNFVQEQTLLDGFFLGEDDD